MLQNFSTCKVYFPCGRYKGAYSHLLYMKGTAECFLVPLGGEAIAITTTEALKLIREDNGTDLGEL